MRSHHARNSPSSTSPMTRTHRGVALVHSPQRASPMSAAPLGLCAACALRYPGRPVEARKAPCAEQQDTCIDVTPSERVFSPHCLSVLDSRQSSGQNVYDSICPQWQSTLSSIYARIHRDRPFVFLNYISNGTGGDCTILGQLVCLPAGQLTHSPCGPLRMIRVL